MLNILDRGHREQSQAEKVKARQELDNHVREPGTTMSQYRLQFDHLVFVANDVAQVN